MSLLEDIVADARARGIRPWILLKERLAERAIGEMAYRDVLWSIGRLKARCWRCGGGLGDERVAWASS